MRYSGTSVSSKVAPAARPSGMAFSPNRAKRGGANLQDARQFIGRIGAIVPKMRKRVRAARRPRIFVGDVDESGFCRIAQDGVESRAFASMIGELAIAVVDRRPCPRVRYSRRTLKTDRARRSGRALSKDAGSPSPRPTRKVRAEMRWRRNCAPVPRCGRFHERPAAGCAPAPSRASGSFSGVIFLPVT